MFRHIMKYMSLTYLKDKQAMFWTMLFPFAYMLIMYFALSSMMQPEVYAFDPVNVAVVENGENEEETEAFQSFLKNVGVPGTLPEGAEELESDPNATAPETVFVRYVDATKEEADLLLDENKIYAYIEAGDKINMTAKNTSETSSLNGSVLKTLLDSYSQMRNTTQSVVTLAQSEQIQMNPDFGEKIQRAMSAEMDLQSDAEEDGTADAIIYFFAALGYVAIFSMSNGILSVAEIEANQSPRAMRSWLAPYPKWKRFFASTIVVIATQVVRVILIYYFLRLLNLDLGDQEGWIIAFLTLATITGVFIGTAIGSLFKGTPGLKIGLGIGIPLFWGFLSGMMAVQIRSLVRDTAPLLIKFNPVALVTEGLYSLYSYSTMDRFFEAVTYMLILLAVSIVLTIIGLRRSNYESL